jgi:diadenosine tetraphosphate (Ap4A) HIT family hydrolase
MASDPNCPYCAGPGGRTVWADDSCRVVLIEDSAFAGLSRVVWNDHVRELSDLSDIDRNRLMGVVAATESSIRELMSPFKMNLGALGTGMPAPHLHIHVVPRYQDDTHFPDPIWAAAKRDAGGPKLPEGFAGKLSEQLNRRLGQGKPLN